MRHGSHRSHHPSIERAIALATEHGSRAETLRGQIRAAIGAMRDTTTVAVWRSAPRAGDWRHAPWAPPREQNLGRTECELRRATDPRAVARDNGRFRRALRDRYRRALVAMQNGPDPREAWVSLDSRRAAAAQIVAAIERLGGRAQQIPDPPGVVMHIDETTARATGSHVDMRGHDAEVVGTTRPGRVEVRESQTEWQRGKPRHVASYRRSYVRSLAWVESDGAVAQIVLGDTQIALPCDATTHRWEIDDIGLMLIRRADGSEYHPTAADIWPLRRTRDLSPLYERIEQAAQARSQLLDASLADADLTRTWVDATASALAGNCSAGTRAVEMSLRRAIGARGEIGAVRADMLLRHRDDMWVRRAVVAAAQRAERERVA